MGFQSGGMFAYLRSSDQHPQRMTWSLLKRVLAYAGPYHVQIIGLLLTILLSTGLGLLTPLIFRDLIDYTLPAGNTTRLNWLALALVVVPILDGGIRVVGRMLNAAIGEGVIYDLRVVLYAHLQRMSLRFFTHTK